MPTTHPKPPSYRRHASGQAFVQHKGQRYYLGKYGTPESQERYQAFLAGILTRPNPALPAPAVDPVHGILVIELSAAYLKHALTYYQRDGQLVLGSINRIKAALKVLRGLYGHTPAAEFGPLKLQAIQGHLVKAKKSRRYINHLAQAIRRVFKWGVSQELVPSSVLQALTAVPGLKKGRTAAVELPAVGPVSDAVFQQTLPFLPRIVADLARLQRLIAARPAEVCLIRPIDVDRSAPVWLFRPMTHKTDYRDGRGRVIPIGPRGQEILRKYLLRAPEDYCFVPAESVEEVNAERRANRQTPMTPSQAARRRKARPKLAPGRRYSTTSYRQAIIRAIRTANRQAQDEAEKAGLPKPELLPSWCPCQLRHTAATEIRQRFGLEACQVVLGHAQMNTSEIYAEKNLELAFEVARRIG